ncbi:MAG: hypothetical protein AAF357_09475, partial [Verrucomicrobiota bacterium]
MALQEILLPAERDAAPEKISAWIEGANKRTDEFYSAGLGLRYPKYIQSDPLLFYTSVAFLKSEDHLLGDVFCEWGCGFGIATGIASLMGMNAFGIEIEDELFDRATRLLNDFNLPAEILNI